MKLVLNPSHSAIFNLALEEYLMTGFDDEFFMLWTSEPSILIGKHQNTYTEINIPYVALHKIPVVRRMSGGGTVFCDPGNINFTFIENNLTSFADFKKFTAPIIAYIQTLGAPAEFSGRNDLVINDQKFSGNAQYRIKNRILHHGTLLFDSQIGSLVNALTPKEEKFTDKSVNSVKARVTNIKAHIKDQDMTIDDLRKGIYAHILEAFEGSSFMELTKEDIAAVEALVKSKYATWDWNYGESPKYDYNNIRKFKGGMVELGLTVQKGIIRQLAIHGDYFSTKDTAELCSKLEGIRHEKSAILRALENLDFNAYLQGISADEFSTFMTEI
jgi:lipoyltransferase and lipoate-protein ligase